ncbi:MAG: hypothetical protein IMZ55_06360, partial [Acidobacteria bacterium]|nr:hypothetical protein [Acidobacteriota bacterium]
MRHSRNVILATVLASAALALPAGGLAAQEPAQKVEPASATNPSPGARPATAAEYDAQFIKMEIPQQVLTGQVFAVKITMKNTGSKAWEGEGHAHLHSQDPPDNTTWGTHFIIQGQGTRVAPGAEKVYQSQLKAPATPGEFGFQWRLVQPKGGAFFGEPTARAVIKVEKRAEERPAARPPQDPN